MTKQISKMTMSRLALASVCFLCLAGCTGNIALGPDAVKGQTPDGFVEMHEVQAAYMASGSGGGGDLFSFAACNMRLMSVASVSVALASPPSRPRARCTTSATSGSSPAPMARPATGFAIGTNERR